ncbi:MAG: DUF1295 domain-containing protein [Cytophagales bacterium]|nr:DUF1295 domain-containing protein [Cytophagales bacterium]
MIDLNPYLLSLLLSIGFNLIIFLIAFRFQTDKLTDITYASTFGILALVLFWHYGNHSSWYRQAITVMILLWAIRLGGYLFRRILQKGKDSRFDSFRHSIRGFGGFYTLQAISIWIVILPTIAALSSNIDFSPHLVEFSIGSIVFMIGWLLEIVADHQKFNFRSLASNDGKFMSEGLFSIIRFPNYLGEILVWSGIFITTIPALSGLSWLTIVGPIWITFLLIKVSGIPYLERSNKERYGHLESFHQYQKTTKKLIPGIF